jgi:hypothetical protein
MMIASLLLLLSSVAMTTGLQLKSLQNMKVTAGHKGDAFWFMNATVGARRSGDRLLQFGVGAKDMVQIGVGISPPRKTAQIGAWGRLRFQEVSFNSFFFFFFFFFSPFPFF